MNKSSLTRVCLIIIALSVSSLCVAQEQMQDSKY